MAVKTLTRGVLVDLQKSGQKFKLIDVRDHVYYLKEHIKGAISIPLSELKDKGSNLSLEGDAHLKIIPKKIAFQGTPVTLVGRKLKVDAAGGLTDNDFVMARIIDEIAI